MKFGKTFLITGENVHEYIEDIGRSLKDFLQDNGRKGVVIGMSGGVDCSVVARLCQKAEIDVYLSLMPYGNDMRSSSSYAHSMELIEKFGFDYEIHDIQQACDSNSVSLDHPFATNADPRDLELAVMNRRPRARTMHLCELAQLSKRSFIGTSNLNEIITGYFTIWGDNAGEYQPLAWLTKREVYILAKALELPESIVSAAPSAGLDPNQTDEAELGFSHEAIDRYIIDETSGDLENDYKIEKRHLYSAFKRRPTPYYEGMRTK